MSLPANHQDVSHLRILLTFVAAFVLSLAFVATVALVPLVLPGLFEPLAWIGVGAAVVFAIGRRVARGPLLPALGAETPATAADYPDLLIAVDRISTLANIAPPPVVVVDTPGTNAWTRRTPRREGTIFVTQGLLDHAKPHELEAVLAHEVGHIVNRDTDLRRIVGACLWLPGLMLRLMGSLVTSLTDSEPGMYVLVLAVVCFWFPILVSVVFYVLSFEVMMLFSRQRELAADRYAAAVLGDTAPLISALLGLTGKAATRLDLRLADARSIEMILPRYVDPDAGFDIRQLFLRTHPSVQRRLRELGSDVVIPKHQPYGTSGVRRGWQTPKR